MGSGFWPLSTACRWSESLCSSFWFWLKRVNGMRWRTTCTSNNTMWIISPIQPHPSSSFHSQLPGLLQNNYHGIFIPNPASIPQEAATLYMGSQILRYAKKLIVDLARKKKRTNKTNKKNSYRKNYAAKWKVKFFCWLGLSKELIVLLRYFAKIRLFKNIFYCAWQCKTSLYKLKPEGNCLRYTIFKLITFLQTWYHI